MCAVSASVFLESILLEDLEIHVAAAHVTEAMLRLRRTLNSSQVQQTAANGNHWRKGATGNSSKRSVFHGFPLTPILILYIGTFSKPTQSIPRSLEKKRAFLLFSGWSVGRRRP